MIKNYHTHAIVLKRKNLNETDKIVTLFTPKYGKISVIAKGIRRIQSRKAPYLEVFNNVSLYLACGRTFDIITEVKPIDTFTGMRSMIQKVAIAYRYVEQVDRLSAERQLNDRVYFLLKNSLEKLNNAENIDIQNLTDQFTLALLRELGYLSNTQLMIGQDIDAYFEQIIERVMTSSNLLARVMCDSSVPEYAYSRS